MEKVKYPQVADVPIRYVLKTGKWGMYFHDRKTGTDMDLQDVLIRLELYELRKAQLKFYVEKYGEQSLTDPKELMSCPQPGEWWQDKYGDSVLIKERATGETIDGDGRIFYVETGGKRFGYIRADLVRPFKDFVTPATTLTAREKRLVGALRICGTPGALDTAGKKRLMEETLAEIEGT